LNQSIFIDRLITAHGFSECANCLLPFELQCISNSGKDLNLV